MNGWIRFAAAAAAIACTPVSAQPNDDDQFCYDLQRIVAAADEEVPFYSLEHSAAAPPTLGFSHHCRANGAGRQRAWMCGRSLAPESLSLPSLSARTAACLAQAQHIVYATWRETEFRLPNAIIRISESGGPGAHVGRIVSYSVDAIARPPAQPVEGNNGTWAGKKGG